jgi:hypothetical protein
VTLFKTPFGDTRSTSCRNLIGESRVFSHTPSPRFHYLCRHMRAPSQTTGQRPGSGYPLAPQNLSQRIKVIPAPSILGQQFLFAHVRMAVLIDHPVLTQPMSCFQDL